MEKLHLRIPLLDLKKKRNVEPESDKLEPTARKRGYISLEGLYHVAPRLRHMADDNGNRDDDNGARHDHGKQIFGRESTPNLLFLPYRCHQHYHKPPTAR